MSLVAWVSWYKTRGTADTTEGYFLAGRGLGATFIAGSLLLTNLSAEQLHRDDLVDTVARVLATHGLPARRLCLAASSGCPYLSSTSA